MDPDLMVAVFAPYLRACLEADPREEAKACLEDLDETYPVFDDEHR